MSSAARRNYIALSAFLFCFFFAQAMAISLLSIWLTRKLGLNGVQVGTVFSANFIGAMCAQPVYGYVSDRMGLRRLVPICIAVLVLLAGGFFTFVYAPLLKWNVVVGAIVGGAY
ncbi:MAG: MFS transporter, partial [Asticcacaulis sp.]|nr:MFS transporter [Asticcacaulis sp.]